MKRSVPGRTIPHRAIDGRVAADAAVAGGGETWKRVFPVQLPMN